MTEHHLPTDYQRYMHYSKYSRWIEDEKRRETVAETVARYFDFMQEHLLERCNYVLQPSLRKELEDAVLNCEVMPSMRAMWAAGKALQRDEAAAFNCTFMAVDHPRAFDESFYLAMCGCGVGYSVEARFVEQLPSVAEEFYTTASVIVVEDSKIGWAKALKELISMLYVGQVPSWDTSKVRKAGSKLKTFGGRASGPEPLEQLFRFTVTLFKGAASRRLTSLECHDLMCMVGKVVVVGGVRRTAQISLSDLHDEQLRHAKSGTWYNSHPWRSLANNSAVYNGTPPIGVFMDEWKALYDSKSGERGIFNRDAAKKQMIKHGRRDPNHYFGLNPCGEVQLRPAQMCNLSEVILRPEDTFEDIQRKVRIATILGTFQSTLTNFRYLRKIWQKNCEEERLLGVSFSGIMDNPIMSTLGPNLDAVLDTLREGSILFNEEYAKYLGIPASTAITLVKPSGNNSQRNDCSSGIHPRWSQYYLRTVREDNKSSITKFLKEMGVPHEPDAMFPETNTVFTFPVKSPEDAKTRHDVDAITMLEIALTYRRHWCEHNPSTTIYIKEEEWLKVGAWIYEHFDEVGGMAFLPASDANYKQMPYTEIDEDTYILYDRHFPKDIDWSRLADYEEDGDTTTGAQESQCEGVCSIAQ